MKFGKITFISCTAVCNATVVYCDTEYGEAIQMCVMLKTSCTSSF